VIYCKIDVGAVQHRARACSSIERADATPFALSFTAELLRESSGKWRELALQSFVFEKEGFFPSLMGERESVVRNMKSCSRVAID
jgi:hypothetical protein